MPLEPPPIDSEITTLADWLEIRALSAPDGRALLGEIRSQFILEQATEPDDWSDEDEAIDDLLSKLSAKIAARTRIIGAHYPFSLSSDGTSLLVRDEFDDGAIAYLFCLFIAQANGSEILSGTTIPALSNSDRDLFQVCATLCAASVAVGSAVSFGWPRPDRTSVIEKLKQIEARLSAQVRDEALVGAGAHVKDDEIDVIAWRSEADNLPPSYYLLGQAASGRNWKSKSPRTAIDHVFHPTWFVIQPPTAPQPAVFIPFVQDEDEEFPAHDDEGNANAAGSVAWRNTLQLGSIFCRYRLPRYVAQIGDLSALGIHLIERVGDYGEVRAWVIAFRARLQAEVAL